MNNRFAIAAALSVGLLTASLARADGIPRPAIDCTGTDGKATVAFRIDGSLLYSAPAGEKQAALLERRVEGAGAKARTVLKFEDEGAVEYKDVYGCLSEVRARLPGRERDLKNAKCVTQGAPRCASR